MQFSPQQEGAVKAVGNWFKQKKGPQFFYLGGYAGTGKTTLAKEFAAGLKGKGAVLYGAFTGKAALVLQRKGCDGASTIHSMIYRVRPTASGEAKFTLDRSSPVKEAKLVVIDECSMVDEQLGKDLLSFGTKVLVLGDPAQLPPVKGSGFFTARDPDFMLTEVHRQAADNPIIRLSMDIRMGGRLTAGPYGESRVITKAQLDPDEVIMADQVLVGLNRTRHAYNRRMRQLLDRDPHGPVRGDRLVCLRNDKSKDLLNGGLWTIDRMLGANSDGISMEVASLDLEGMHQEVLVPHEFFEGREGDLDFASLRGKQQFTYGYALTVHKSQGSQWDDVMVFDESGSFREDRAKWLYTAVTRAAERVVVVL